MVKAWIKDVCKNRGNNIQLYTKANAKIFSFGSYRLGVCYVPKLSVLMWSIHVSTSALQVHGPGSDIDVLCLCPQYTRLTVI